MSSIFSELGKEREKQQQLLARPETRPAQRTAQKVEQKAAQTVERKTEQVSRKVSKLPSAEAVELLHFRLRKARKVKVNTEVPLEWKEQLDEMVHQLKVGKYELLLYIIGHFLGRVEQGQDAA